MGINSDMNVTSGILGNDSRYEAIENKCMQCKKNSRKGEIRMRSGHESCKSERLGIEQ